LDPSTTLLGLGGQVLAELFLGVFAGREQAKMLDGRHKQSILHLHIKVIFLWPISKNDFID